MITRKNEALEEVTKQNPNMSQIDESLLKDEDVVRAYIQLHSSNEMLVNRKPIDIDVKGLIDNETFIIDVIKNLDIGYDVNGLNSLITYSTKRIIKEELNANPNYTACKLKEMAEGIMLRYRDAVKMRGNELAHKQEILNEVGSYIENAINKNNTNANKAKGKIYCRTDVGFTAKF